LPVIEPKTPTQDRVRADIAREQERLSKEFIDRAVQVQSQLFDKAATYNNIVVTLGYAGFFAIWNFIKRDIHVWDNLLVAGLLGMSLLIFIAWTVFSNMRLSVRNIGIAKILGSDSLSDTSKLNELRHIDAKWNKSDLRYYGAWYWVFLISVVSGFSAGILLLVLALLQMIEIDFSIHDLIWGQL